MKSRHVFASPRGGGYNAVGRKIRGRHAGTMGLGDRHDGPHEANLFDINAKYGDVISKTDAMKYIKGLKKP